MGKKEEKHENKQFQKIVAHAKEYGFVFPSSEIYDGLQAVYDYGSNGVELKNNLKQFWWKSMVQMNENIVGIDSSIFMHPTIWKASGHVDGFNDPMVDNKDSNKRYRADVLIEDKAAQHENAGDKAKADALLQKMGQLLSAEDLAGVKELIENEEIACPISGTVNWTDVRQFNLMFDTQLGATAEGASSIYLRPETAQGIFVNFLNVQKTSHQKVPFGIAQIGKAFRNEIVARQFIFRMREFEQMEMQFFVQPGKEMDVYEEWKEKRMRWHKVLGTPTEKLRFHDHEKLAHYANAACDIEFDFPFGFKEVEGIHSRTDFDLMQHQQYSKKKQQFFDPTVNKNYVPYVVETSIGADRLFLLMLSNAYTELEVNDENKKTQTRTFLKLPPALAPVQAAILPIVKKDGLAEIGRDIFNKLKFDFKVVYEEQQGIGKRYVRQDLIGTPFCIAVDHQTKEDNMVTVRDRDTTDQVRMPIEELPTYLGERVSMTNLLKKL